MIENAYLRGKKLLCGEYTQFTPAGKGLFVRRGYYGKEPKLGAIPYFYNPAPELKRVAHVGIVTEVDETNGTFKVETVEGNTSGKSYERNGGMVGTHIYTFKLSDVGGTNRINGFGYPQFGEDTCDVKTFIEVAKAELGYLEKKSRYQLDLKTANAGDKNFTKYGEWYGNNGVYWCQQYVSWCAYEACRQYMLKKSTGWEQDGDKWRYKLAGVYVKGQWLEIGGRWYVFDEAGYMITGWFKSDDDWYYLNPEDGAMLSGQWLSLDGNSYYLTKSGVMAANTYIKEPRREKYYWIGSDGLWVAGKDTSEPEIGKYGVAE